MVVAGMLDTLGAALSLVRTRAGSDFNANKKKFIKNNTRLLGGEIYT